MRQDLRQPDAGRLASDEEASIPLHNLTLTKGLHRDHHEITLLGDTTMRPAGLRVASNRLHDGGDTLKRLGVTTLLVAILVLGAAAPASALPCWRNLINDWYDGRIDNVYPVKCYQQALREAPADLEEYSDLPADLTRALQGVLSSRGGGGGNQAGPQSRVPSGGPGKTRVVSKAERVEKRAVPSPASTQGRDDPAGPIQRLLNFIGPNNADSIPLPLVFLAGLALLLMATGAAGMVTRRVQARRVPPEPPEPPLEP